MTKSRDLIVTYEKDGGLYCMTPDKIERNVGFGDAGVVEAYFYVKIEDLNLHHIMNLIYRYTGDSFKEPKLKLWKYENEESITGFVLAINGVYIRPPFPDDKLVIDLFGKFMDYLQDPYAQYKVKNETQFSSETHEDNHEDVQRSSLDERTKPNHLYEEIKKEIDCKVNQLEEFDKIESVWQDRNTGFEKQKLQYTLSKLYDALDSVKDLEL